MLIADMSLFALGRDIAFLVSHPRRPSKDELRVAAECLKVSVSKAKKALDFYLYN